MFSQPFRLALFCILLGCYLLVYINRPDAIDGDATLAAAVSLVQHGTPAIAQLGASEGLLPGMSRMGSFGDTGQLYSKKGVTPSIFLLPLVIAAQLAPWLTIRATAMLFNPLITAFTAVLLLTLLRHMGYRAWTAFFTALLYGVATSALVYTKTLFGEPLAALLLMSAVLNGYLYLKHLTPQASLNQVNLPGSSVGAAALPRPHPSTAGGLESLPYSNNLPLLGGRGSRYLLCAGLALGLCVGVNLTYGLLIPLVALFLFGVTPRHWRLRHIAVFAAPIVVCGVLLMAYNVVRFGSPFTSGYNFAQGEGFTYPAGWGLFGLFLSPYRGLLWYNPLVLLALPGFFLLIRRHTKHDTLASRLGWLLLALIAAQALAYAAWWSWHGGIVWGPRFLIPVLPLLMIGIAPLIERKWMLVMPLALLSVGIQLLGVLLDYQLYVGELYQNFASGRVEGMVSGLRDEVFFNIDLSPIAGHVRLLLNGAPLEPSVIAWGLDGVHLLAALAVLGMGLGVLWWTLYTQSPPLAPPHSVGRGNPSPLLAKRGGDLGVGKKRLNVSAMRGGVILLILIALNLVAAQQMSKPNALPAAYHTELQPADTLVVALSNVGNVLLDMEGGTRSISTIAPTAPDDPLASGLWRIATARPGYLWFVTWFAPAQPDNWQERDLWTQHYFVREQAFLGEYRALLFDTTPHQSNTVHGLQGDGWEWGGMMRLTTYVIERDARALRLRLDWRRGENMPDRDYGWFVHVLDAQGSIVAQQDRAPQGGYRMTSTWTDADNPSIPDRLAFPLAPDTDTTGWQLRIGWVDPATGEQLPLTSTASADTTFILIGLNP